MLVHRHSLYEACLSVLHNVVDRVLVRSRFLYATRYHTT
jgi:hypothetical protein